MKKYKKLNKQWRNKIRGLKPGDRVLAEFGNEIKDFSIDFGTVEEIGDKYIVIDGIIVESTELKNIRKI